MEVWIENTGMVELLNAGLRLAAASATFVRVAQSPILAHEPAASEFLALGRGGGLAARGANAARGDAGGRLTM